MEILKTTFDKIKNDRADYFNALPHFQELFIELMVMDAVCYALHDDNMAVGYAIKNTDGALLEFYLQEKYIPQSKEFFDQIINELSITATYCKSFDSLLLSNCLLSSFSYTVVGVLYRDYVKALLVRDPEIEMKRADLSSLELLLRQDSSIQELFESEEQLTGFIENDHVFEFYKNKQFVGCGTVLKTHVDWEYCDLGVWVAPSERGSHIGAQILLNLRNFSLDNNLKPSCGCAIVNIASQKTIEKSGFVSKHKLIKFDVRTRQVTI